MPTSETATKADSQPSGGGGRNVESLITYQVVTEAPAASSVAPGQSLLRKVTVEPANLEASNLNAADFPAQLSDLATLESIQAELDRIQNHNDDGDHLASSSPAVSIELSAAPAATMSNSPDGTCSSFVGSLSDGSSILSTTSSTSSSSSSSSASQGGTRIVNLFPRNDQGLGESASLSHVQNVPTKRPITAVSNAGQMVTKVIITKNPNQSQPVAIPVSGQQIVMMGSQGHTVASNAFGLASPTKTITLNPTGLQSPTKYISALQGSPTKIMQGQKLSLSPMRTPTKITMIPVSAMSKSPQRIVTSTGQVLTMVTKAGGTGSIMTSASSRPTTITMSPSKFTLKQPVTNQAGQKLIMQQLNTVSKMQGISLSSVPNIQPVSVSGSKFQYVRLVTNPAGQTQTTLATAKPASIAPLTLQAKPIMTTANTQMRMTTPSAAVGATQQVLTRPTIQQGQHRILLPATSQVSLRPNSTNSLTQIRPAGSGGPTTLTQLPPGTTIISGQNLAGVQGFALVPAQYVTQHLGQQLQPSTMGGTVQRQESGSGFVPIASTNAPEQTQSRPILNGSLLQEPSGQRPRKPCNCTKSQCLKLYCDCFANGEFCHNCNCTNCANNLEHEEERSRAIKACLDRNPLAFHPKIGKGRGERRHNKGCNCKRSGCLKNYCECYEAKILCTNMCKCIGCKNFEESPDRKTLMHLADAAEVRVNQQTSAKAKLSSQIQDLPIRPPLPIAGERFAYTFVTKDVAEATCACLIAQAEEAERTRQLEMVQERMVLEEFGRCLMQVIDSAGRTRAQSPVP